jgi:hypothetical protein
MNSSNLSSPSNNDQVRETSRSLSKLYFIRASFSIVWVILVFALAKDNQKLAGFLFVIYPLWDAIATFLDIKSSSPGVPKTPQLVNAVISIITTIAVVLALQKSIPDVLIVFGIWQF